MQARVQLAEKLASQLEKWEQARTERQVLDERIPREASTAREIMERYSQFRAA